MLADTYAVHSVRHSAPYQPLRSSTENIFASHRQQCLTTTPTRVNARRARLPTRSRKTHHAVASRYQTAHAASRWIARPAHVPTTGTPPLTAQDRAPAPLTRLRRRLACHICGGSGVDFIACTHATAPATAVHRTAPNHSSHGHDSSRGPGSGSGSRRRTAPGSGPRRVRGARST